MKFSSIPVGMLISVDFTGLVQAAVLSRVHGSNISILFRRHYQASDILDFWVLQSLSSLFCDVLQVLAVGVVLQMPHLGLGSQESLIPFIFF